jgi:hypothetical protein
MLTLFLKVFLLLNFLISMIKLLVAFIKLSILLIIVSSLLSPVILARYIVRFI